MKRNTDASTIADAVHDCTVGAGHDGPCGRDHVAYIESRLGRPMTPPEVVYVSSEWQRCLQMMEQL